MTNSLADENHKLRMRIEGVLKEHEYRELASIVEAIAENEGRAFASLDEVQESLLARARAMIERRPELRGRLLPEIG
jgi:hypothetical protein